MTTLFYLLTAFIWGTTWYSIKVHQLSGVPLELSNFYRFIIAFLVLLIFSSMKKRTWQKLYFKDHAYMVAQGLFLFCLNYFCYMASVTYIPSGLTCLAFSSIIIFNCLFSSIFLKLPLTPQMIWGGLCGILGLSSIFAKYILNFSPESLEIYGLLFGIGGAFSSSIGHIIAKKAQMNGLDVIQNCLYSMFYGILWWGLYILVSGTPLIIDTSPSYLYHLLYLALIGTTVAFLLFLNVLRSIGPGKASYIFIISPIVALIVSAMFEAFAWTPNLLIGLGFVVLGNILMLRRGS